jgi:DNA mismatch endonuclease (patch repair protein)
MTDMFSKEKRSEIMSRIHSKNTAQERIVFSYLRSQGIYFQKHYKRCLGNPDVAIPSKKKIVFIDGDFWHGYKFNSLTSKLPKVYWREKIRNNIARDRRNRKLLKSDGWSILRIWEHELKRNPERTLMKIADFLTKE